MDSSELLDILGNENRRNILRLLSRKPCYVTEISEYIGVSPKAVIDHLEMLEEAGLVESRVDEKRRKYFHISRSLRLEVDVSPYSFGVKSAYPCRTKFNYEYVEIENIREEDESLDDPVARLEKLEKVKNELSIAQRHVQARMEEIMESIEEEMNGEKGKSEEVGE
ncbi:MAG: ArsR family transcriptional regulator [Halobacteriales archaeon]|nr:ArsR family transcriptional regulator [Halobacteriales archaeon]